LFRASIVVAIFFGSLLNANYLSFSLNRVIARAVVGHEEVQMSGARSGDNSSDLGHRKSLHWDCEQAP